MLIEALQVHLHKEHGLVGATSVEKTKELEEEHRKQLELRRKWEKQQRAAAKRRREDDDDDDDEDDDPDDPDYRPSKKQLKKAGKRGDK